MEWEVVALPGGAATAGISYQLPGGERTRIGSLAFEVGCSGGGSARQVVAQLKDGTGATVFGIGAPGTQASGLAVVYAFAPLVLPFGSDNLGFIGGPFPGGWLPPNMVVEVQVVSAGGSDVISNGRLLVQQYQRIPASDDGE